MNITNLWIHKDDVSAKLYSLKGDTACLKSILDIDCHALEELGQDPPKGAFGLYENQIHGALFPLRIAIYDQDYIANYKIQAHQEHVEDQKVFAQNYFKDDNQETVDYRLGFSPIIHIVPGLTWSDFEDGIKPAERFFRITDSSIWNYFVVDQTDLDRVIKDIRSNWENKYYNLYITKEFADLNARLTIESYIYEFTKSSENKGTTSSGHAADVSPFLFHSEQRIKKKRKENETKLNKILNFKEYKWRILLVDDRIENAYLQPQKHHVSKELILKQRIEDYLFVEKDSCKCVYLEGEKPKYNVDTVFDILKTDNSKTKIVILCVNSIEKAELALKNYKFDFILLDYLLDRTDPKNKTEKRHYGYEILTDLDGKIGRDCSDLSSYLHYTDGSHFIVGPGRRYFFMFISAFTTAISERLRLEGFSRSEELWHIAEGACPTNTPELFCYNLQMMMIKRLKDSGIENLDSTNILKIMKDIYCREDGESSVRKRANDKYQSVLSLLYHYNRILEDTELVKDIFTINESVLMTSYIMQHEELGGLLEHLMHLVHLTAFGTARQWPEMWEEYLYFKNQFDTLFSAEDKEKLIELKNEKVKVEQVLQKLYGKIEEYILDLKKNN